MTDLTEAGLGQRAAQAHYEDGHAKGCSPACVVEIDCIRRALVEVRDAAYAEQRERDAKIAEARAAKEREHFQRIIDETGGRQGQRDSWAEVADKIAAAIRAYGDERARQQAETAIEIVKQVAGPRDARLCGMIVKEIRKGGG